MILLLVAPVALSVLTHITVILYTSLITIGSFWTAHRVKLARTAFSTSLDDQEDSDDDFLDEPLASSFLVSSRDIAAVEYVPPIVSRRHTSPTSAATAASAPISPQSATSSPLMMRRTLSLSGSAYSPTSPASTRLATPILSPMLGSGDSYFTAESADRRQSIKSGVIPETAFGDEGASLLLYNPTQYWLNYDLKSGIQGISADDPLGAPLLPPFAEATKVNAPTGSIVSGKLGGAHSLWDTRNDSSLKSQKRSGRIILSCLAACRVATPVPAILSFMRMSEMTTGQVLRCAFDLVFLDALISLGLALLPFALFARRLSFKLPSSFEHHHYYCNLILIALPLLITMQLPQTATISIYRMASPILSALMLLIARDQATANYWSPMARKARWTFGSSEKIAIM